MTIPIGTVVSLRSGGPYMTVTSATAGGHIVGCSWFDDESAGVFQENFPVVSLIVYKVRELAKTEPEFADAVRN